MVVTVKLFATFRDGRFEKEPRDCPPGTTIDSILKDLRIPIDLVGVLMVNNRHAFPDRVLQPGDVLAIFPLVGGG